MIKEEANAIVETFITQLNQNQLKLIFKADVVKSCTDGQVTKSVGWMPWH